MAHRIAFKDIRTVLSLMAPPRIRTKGRRLPGEPFRDAAVAWYAAYEDFTTRGGGMTSWTQLVAATRKLLSEQQKRYRQEPSQAARVLDAGIRRRASVPAHVRDRVSPREPPAPRGPSLPAPAGHRRDDSALCLPGPSGPPRSAGASSAVRVQSTRRCATPRPTGRPGPAAGPAGHDADADGHVADEEHRGGHPQERPPIVNSRAIGSQCVTRPAMVNARPSGPPGSGVGPPSSAIGAVVCGPEGRLGLDGQGAALALPEVEALDVQLQRLPALGQADALDHELILGDDRLAGVAGLPVAGAAPDSGGCCSTGARLSGASGG
jgi:hypothetical protein